MVSRSKMMRGEESDGRVFKTVLFYCLLILVLPISTFFISKSLVFEWFLGQVRESILDYGTLSLKEPSHYVRYDQKSHLVEMALVGACDAEPVNFNRPMMFSSDPPKAYHTSFSLEFSSCYMSYLLIFDCRSPIASGGS